MATPALRFLKTFQIAARRGSFKAAADELCVTPSAVSHQIKVLETQLGLALFERGTRALSLTEAGAQYFEQLDALFSRLESVTEQLRLRFSRAVVRLQVPPFFASELLVPRLRLFSGMNAAIDILITTDYAPNEAQSPDADVSIVVGRGPWAQAQAARLFPQAYVPACSPELLRQARIRTAADMASAALIAHDQRPDLWDRWAAMYGIDALRPKQLIRFDTMSAVVNAAERGVGIALVSAPLSAARFAAGTLIKVFERELATGESYYLLERADEHAAAGVIALVAWLLAQFGDSMDESS
jgi:LysR family transcriptional regulator, glycine cleavage system transcriptional activator